MTPAPQTPLKITYLEMHSPLELNPVECEDNRFWVGEATVKQWEFNRFLYLTVGGNWSWNEKRNWPDEKWREYACDENLRTFGAYVDGAPAGYYELKKHADGSVEIAYFGLMPAFIGRGLGGPLLTRAIRDAWTMTSSRVWVHTCTLDHPSALKNYQSRGMKIYQVLQ